MSTATVHNVQLSHNGAVITCLDDVSIQPDDQSVNGTVHIHNSNLAILLHHVILLQFLAI